MWIVAIVSYSRSVVLLGSDRDPLLTALPPVGVMLLGYSASSLEWTYAVIIGTAMLIALLNKTAQPSPT